MIRTSRLIIRSTKSIGIRKKSTQDADVLFETQNKTGIITLNRPKELNCLTTPMLSKIILKLHDWIKNKNLIIMKGAGKALSIGGDVMLCDDLVKGPELFCHEFNLVYLINTCQVPYVTFADGFTIGAGLGISIAGKFRIATEKTVLSMPEIIIGLCPGLGATYIFPRLKSKIGYYLGLTGHKLRGSDTVHAGLATHFVPSERMVDLELNLLKCSDEAQILHILSKFCEFKQTSEFTLTPFVKYIEKSFSAPTLDELYKRLEKTNNEWSKKTLESFSRVSPTILKVTFRAFESGAKMDFEKCLKMEYMITCHAVQQHDFKEGVRSHIIDKDKDPKWNPKLITEVKDEDVEKFFHNIPGVKELSFE